MHKERVCQKPLAPLCADVHPEFPPRGATQHPQQLIILRARGLQHHKELSILHAGPSNKACHLDYSPIVSGIAQADRFQLLQLLQGQPSKRPLTWPRRIFLLIRSASWSPQDPRACSRSSKRASQLGSHAPLPAAASVVEPLLLGTPHLTLIGPTRPPWMRSHRQWTNPAPATRWVRRLRWTITPPTRKVRWGMIRLRRPFLFVLSYLGDLLVQRWENDLLPYGFCFCGGFCSATATPTL